MWNTYSWNHVLNSFHKSTAYAFNFWRKYYEYSQTPNLVFCISCKMFHTVHKIQAVLPTAPKVFLSFDYSPITSLAFISARKNPKRQALTSSWHHPSNDPCRRDCILVSCSSCPPTCISNLSQDPKNWHTALLTGILPYWQMCMSLSSQNMGYAL